MAKSNFAGANYDVPHLLQNIQEWHYQRNLIEGATDEAQLGKLSEECWELEMSLKSGESPIDDIGDIIVVLVNIAERNELSIQECLAHAWGDIKDRTGKMVDGVFVKDE